MAKYHMDIPHEKNEGLRQLSGHRVTTLGVPQIPPNSWYMQTLFTKPWLLYLKLAYVEGLYIGYTRYD